GGGRGGAGAKLSRAGKILKSPGKFLRALKKFRVRKRYSERERRRLLLLYWKVRLYYRTVAEGVLLYASSALAIVIFALDFLTDDLELLRETWFERGLYLTSGGALLAIFGEMGVANRAVSAFSEAVLRGGGLPAALGAFQAWAVYGTVILLAMYVAFVLLAVALTRKEPDVRTLPVLAVPLATGIWALNWGLWVVS
ncbi:hypothetical protein, partial [Methanopyrus kandleri]